MSKKSKKRAEDRNNIRTLREECFDGAIAASEKIADPAERILALHELQTRLSDENLSEISTIGHESRKATKKTYFVGIAPVLGATALVSALTGGIGGLIVFPLLVANAMSTSRRASTVLKKLIAEATPHLEHTKSQLTHVDELMNAAVENNVEALSLSPLRDKVMNVPGIKEKFAEVAADQIAQNATAPAPEVRTDDICLTRKIAHVPRKNLDPS